MAGQALAYVPLTFRTLDEYLAARSPSRRKDLRRKLRVRRELDIVAVSTGSAMFDDPDVRKELYGLYLNVYAQSANQFDLLTPGFFRAVLGDTDSGGIVFIYHHRGEMVGFNLCFVCGDKLIDKYIGLRYPKARDLNLYVISWMHNLEFALSLGLNFYVAGWTDPQVKRDLGASFTWTEHAVYSRSAVLRTALRALRRFFENDAQWHLESGRATSVNP
jgi:predicted N-acyltransferase